MRLNYTIHFYLALSILGADKIIFKTSEIKINELHNFNFLEQLLCHIYFSLARTLETLQTAHRGIPCFNTIKILYSGSQITDNFIFEQV